jgi:hypothetical protein
MSVNDYDEQLYEVIRELVDEGDLDEKSAAYGIAMQVVHQGHGSLTDKQRFVYERDVEALLLKRAPPSGPDE